MDLPVLYEKGLSILSADKYYILPLLLFLSVLYIRWLWRSKLNLPPGPMGLPIVGYLPFLENESFKTLHRLKNKYGNVFSLYLGRTRVTILADYKAAEEALRSSSTADKPPDLFSFLPDGFGFGSINGEAWNVQRRFATKTMKDVGLGRNTWASLVEDEITDFVKAISDQKGQPVDIFALLTPSISNNISSLVFGKRLSPGPDRDRINQSMDKITAFFSQTSAYNYLPFIGNILSALGIGSYYKSYKEMEYFNSFIKKEVEMYRKSKSDSKESFFISQYIDAMESSENKEKKTSFTERNLIGGTQVLFIGGSDTTRASLCWLFLAMTAYPEVQKKVQSELDSVLGIEQTALWENRSKFPYTYATILEGQRWKTIVPLNASRRATADIKVCGYDIPKGSTLIANYWGVHNDTRYWTAPEEFNPQRFLKNDGKEVNLKPESYAPFSYGKRRCPGETVAMMEIFLYFTALMKLFDVRTPGNVKPNLDGTVGIVYQPISQDLCFIPRS